MSPLITTKIGCSAAKFSHEWVFDPDLSFQEAAKKYVSYRGHLKVGISDSELFWQLFFWETLYIKGRICQHACPEETVVFVSMGRWKEGYWGQLSASSWRSRRGKEGRQDRAVNGEFLGWKREEILRSIIKRGEETGQKPAVAKAGEAREDFLGKTDSNV